MSGQAISFLGTVLAGAVLGVFYDFFRVLRKTLRHKTMATAAEDAIFWLVATLLIFVFLLYTNSGEIRGFTFLGVILGAALYFSTASRFFIKYTMAIISPVKIMLRTIKKRLKSGRRYVIVKKQTIHQRIKRRFDDDAKQGHQN